MKKLTLLFVLAIFATINIVQAQTVDELKAMKSEKMAAADALLGEVGDLQKQIDEFPGWKIGGVGIVGFDLNSNSNWFAIDNPNSSASGYGIGASAFANKDASGYFWRNLLTLNIKKSNTKINADADGVEALTDALDISSLYGKKLNEKWAISAEGKYQSTLLRFNDPGKLVLSAGVTWLPINNLVVLIHPLGYEFNFPGGDFVSSAGAKIGATYAATIIPGVAWTSNLSAFIPYGGGPGTLNRLGLDADGNTTDEIVATSPIDYSGGDLMNWTWINGFSTNLFKGIGVGFNLGLRSDKQINNAAAFQASSLSTGDVLPAFDNELQMYYTLGLSYTL